MVGFGALMIGFSIFTLLSGIYFYTGHHSWFLLWRAHVDKNDKKTLKKIGIATMITSIAPLISGIVALLFKEDNIIPMILLLVLLILCLILSVKIYTKE